MGYSDDREQIKELKYLRKVLGELDANIPVPDSVRGDALRHKLDNIIPAVPPAPDKRSGVTFGLQWFSLHSGLTCAAAFLLIIGLFYGMGFHQQPDIVERSLPIEQQEPVQEYALFSTAELDPDTPAADATDKAPPPSAPYAAGAEGAEQESLSEAGRGATPAVGGGGQSELLGVLDGYSYAWRTNDASDPDKAGYPVTVDIVLDSASQVVHQIDIADMSAINDAYLAGTTLSLVGVDDGQVVVHSYDVADPQEPVERAVIYQPGSYLGSRLYKNLLHIVSYTEDPERITCEIEALPYSMTQSACVISALNTTSGENSQKAFQGADASIEIFDLRAYITYRGLAEDISADADGEVPAQDADTDAAATALHVAQILLDGLEISISSVS